MSWPLEYIGLGVLSFAFGWSLIASATWDEVHHFYWAALALWLWPEMPAAGRFVCYVVMTDDIVQHLVQGAGKPYLSPIHRGYEAAARFGLRVLGPAAAAIALKIAFVLLALGGVWYLVRGVVGDVRDAREISRQEREISRLRTEAAVADTQATAIHRAVVALNARADSSARRTLQLGDTVRALRARLQAYRQTPGVLRELEAAAPLVRQLVIRQDSVIEGQAVLIAGLTLEGALLRQGWAASRSEAALWRSSALMRDTALVRMDTVLVLERRRRCGQKCGVVLGGLAVWGGQRAMRAIAR